MKRIYALFFITLSTVTLAQPVYVMQVEASVTSTAPQPVVTLDTRTVKLKSFFAEQGSPLTPYASLFIKAADTYHLPDWKLVPAITGVESTFGTQIRSNSYNAYGWINGNHSFISWAESIDTVSKTLKQKYIDRGLTTIESIGHVYAPTSTTWAGKVHFFMHEIDINYVKQAKYLAFTL